jgi:hypothetical protein
LKIRVEQRVGVFVIDRGVLKAFAILVEAHDRVLTLPSVLKNTADFGCALPPEIGSEIAQIVFVLGSKYGENRASVESHFREADTKDGAHLFELKREVTGIAGAAVGENAEMGASDFNPGTLASRQRRDGADTARERHDERGRHEGAKRREFPFRHVGFRRRIVMRRLSNVTGLRQRCDS